MTPREALLVLNLLEGIGPIRTRQLLEFFGEAPHPALRRVKGIGDDLASTIRQWETTNDLAGELKRVEGFGARLVFQEDDEYPELLREIYDPPIVLYAKGRLLPEDRNSIAMEGAPDDPLRAGHHPQTRVPTCRCRHHGGQRRRTRYRLRLASGRPLGQRPNPRRARHRHQHSFTRRKTRSCTNASRRTAPCLPSFP